MVYSFNFPVRVKLHNVALFGEKDCIDTLHNQSFLLRIIKDVSFSRVNIEKDKYLMVLLTRYKEKQPRFVILIPSEYEERFIDCLPSEASVKNISFDFHYPNPTLSDVLPANDTISQEQDANDNNNLHTIHKLLQSPLLLPSVADDIENKYLIDDCSSDANVFHTSHIHFCFHS